MASPSLWTPVPPRLHIRRRNAGGRPILLVHGLAGNVHWWDTTAALLPEGLDVAALDLRGHGDSEWAEKRTYSTDGFVADIEEARRFLGWETMILAGHSLGARICLEYAARFPASVSRLVAVDFMPEIKSSSPRFSRPRPVRQPVFSDREAMTRRFHLQPPETKLSATALRDLAALSIKPMGAGYTWKCDWNTFLLRYAPVWPFLDRIKIPVLIARGERSPIMDREDVRKILDRLRSGKSVEIPGAYHHVPLDDPNKLATAVSRFSEETSPA